MASEGQTGLDDVLQTVSAKQDRLEKRLEGWHTALSEQLKDLRDLYEFASHMDQSKDQLAIAKMEESLTKDSVLREFLAKENADEGVSGGLHEDDDNTSRGLEMAVSGAIPVEQAQEKGVEKAEEEQKSVVDETSNNQHNNATGLDPNLLKSQQSKRASRASWRQSIRASKRGERPTGRKEILQNAASQVLHNEKDTYDAPKKGAELKSWRHSTFEEHQRIANAMKLEDAVEQAMEDPLSPIEETSSLRQTISERISNIRLVDVIRRLGRPSQQESSRRSSTGSLAKEPNLFRLSRHPMFQCVCGSVVLLNSILVGVTVEIEANDNEAHVLFEILSQSCSLWFIVELAVRIMAVGPKIFFMFADERLLNIFDTLLVILSIVDALISFVNGSENKDFSMGQALKTVRLLRILRLFKILRFFPELGLMVFMICECLTSLLWAIVLLMIILYTFAVIFTHSAAVYRRQEIGNLMVDLADVEEKFGTLSRTCYYLFQSMLGGISWGLVADTLVTMDKGAAVLFFFYIAFTTLAVLNIVTGIFVDNALETSKSHREYIHSREEKAKHKTIKALSRLFDDMDIDGSGSITFEEMCGALDDLPTRKCFAAIGFQVEDMQQVFEMMDDDGSGEVDMVEFLNGCGRCTGDVKAIDIQAILHDVKRLHVRLDEEYPVFPTDAGAPQVSDGLQACVAELKQLKALTHCIAQQFDNAMKDQRKNQRTKELLGDALEIEPGSIPI